MKGIIWAWRSLKTNKKRLEMSDDLRRSCVPTKYNGKSEIGVIFPFISYNSLLHDIGLLCLHDNAEGLSFTTGKLIVAYNSLAKIIKVISRFIIWLSANPIMHWLAQHLIYMYYRIVSWCQISYQGLKNNRTYFYP